ncbi:hypothetical protein JB92DRAFT_1976725 [Gautieria morchelliformis]|nr:hypothetical protein JB92DRAFT_1976725 [Gautieria morchelliformis]
MHHASRLSPHLARYACSSCSRVPLRAQGTKSSESIATRLGLVVKSGYTLGYKSALQQMLGGKVGDLVLSSPKPPPFRRFERCAWYCGRKAFPRFLTR